MLCLPYLEEGVHLSVPRVLIIGLDGATFHLVEPLVQAGDLPNLARLIAGGVHGPLRAWPNMNSAAAWTSMVTGYNPGQHGIYDFGSAAPQLGHRWHPTTAADRTRAPFWRLLSMGGQWVGVLNVPISYPADSVNGFMLAGMDAPTIHSSGFAHPPELAYELRQQGIDYVLDVPKLGDVSKRTPHELPWLVRRMIDSRARTIHYLMRTRPWDAFMAVFVAPDRVQHFYWPPQHGAIGDPEWAPIRNLYRQIDSFFGDALKCIDGNTTVLVVSDHGFGPAYSANRDLNGLFSQLGLLHYHQRGGRLGGRLLRNLLLHGRRTIPLGLQAPLARVLPGLHRRAVSEYGYRGIEWSRTQVFASPSGGRVCINLKGRQPEGSVSPEDQDGLRENVQGILLNLTDPTTGRRLVRAVHRRENVYRGPHVEQAADLIIEWDEAVDRDRLCYQREGLSALVHEPDGRSLGRRWKGRHRSDGIFIAHGPNIRRGVVVADACLYDIAPTILYLQGHPIPGDMDGKVLTDIFAEEQLRRHPVQYSEPPEVGVRAAETVLDTKEARKIEERLRNLGYIE